MPNIPDEQTYHRNPARRYDERYDYANPSEDVAFDPEDHHRTYYNEPYQSAPQDIPLLGMPSHNQYQHLHNENPFDDERRASRVDPFQDPLSHTNTLDHPPLQHRSSYQSMEQPPQLHHQESSYDVRGSSQDAQPPAVDQGGLKRSKTVKPVQLFHGNLVLDCPVPPKILNTIPEKEREYTHMRYTAATCDPADFFEENFTLRQQLYGKPRKTELFIVVTMYNEDDLLFARTMAGVWQNIEFMCRGKKNGGGSWGPDGWKKIVVCVVSDGRAKINARTKGVLTAMGCYQVWSISSDMKEPILKVHRMELRSRKSTTKMSPLISTRTPVESALMSRTN
jgi:chitin synthase